MSKTNIYCILVGLLIAMVSIAEASTSAVGKWKLKEAWRGNEAEPLSITKDGSIYTMDVFDAQEGKPEKLRISIRVGNTLNSWIEILEEGEEQQKIKIGLVMSTRMMAGSEEKQALEDYISMNLPEMDVMKVKGNGEELVLVSEAGARVVFELSNESQN